MSNSLLFNLSVLFDRPTGIATYAQNIVSTLSDLNPTLLSHSPLGDFEHYPIPDDMTPKQGTRGHGKRLLWTQFQLPQIYKKLKANLIYSPIPEAPLYQHCRYVVMCHDLIPLRFPRAKSPLTNYFRYVVPQVLQQSQHIICNSWATAQDIIDFYDLDASKVTPILLGYDTENFYPRTPKKSFINQNPYFLYLGRQDPYKNLPGLINAFAQIKNDTYNLLIAGAKDPRFTPELNRQIRELNLDKRVIFLDYLSYQELPEIISNAIALVFPTFWEGFGLPVLESMACGTPVITSKLASLPEITGDAAILINPYDTAAITFAMLDLAQDNSMRSQLSKRGLARAKEFSWAKTGKATKEVLARYL